MPVDTNGISCCFDDQSSGRLRDYRSHGLSDTSEVILGYLVSTGLAGATVLELGCGIGALADELVKSGAASARGLDLSPRMIDQARALASALGLSKATTFEVGDGASTNLIPSDLVVLDAVFCCYPDALGLLRNSSEAALKKYVVSVPDDRRPLIKVLRHLLPLQVVFSRGPFRFYVHSVRSLVLDMTDKGFKLVYDRKVRWSWSVLAFERAAASPAPG